MEVGAIVLEKWGIADIIIKAVLNHHELGTSDFEQIVYYANLLDNMREVSEDICQTVAPALNINFEKLNNKINIILSEHVKENFPL
jgi:HD-like signal output (HDOD) protein